MIAPRFIQMILQAKDVSCDWRAFVSCQDVNGLHWELRGYGSTPDDAAKQAWERFQDNLRWDAYGSVDWSKEK